MNESGGEYDPYVTADNTELYFTRDGDIYRAQRSAGQFGIPSPVGELNTSQTEGAPVLALDKLTIFFFRGDADFNTWDIFSARRSTVLDGFGVATAVTELNTHSGLDAPEWISDDGCVLVFSSSNRTDGVGGADLYLAARPP